MSKKQKNNQENKTNMQVEETTNQTSAENNSANISDQELVELAENCASACMKLMEKRLEEIYEKTKNLQTKNSDANEKKDTKTEEKMADNADTMAEKTEEVANNDTEENTNDNVEEASDENLGEYSDEDLFADNLGWEDDFPNQYDDVDEYDEYDEYEDVPDEFEDEYANNVFPGEFPEDFPDDCGSTLEAEGPTIKLRSPEETKAALSEMMEQHRFAELDVRGQMKEWLAKTTYSDFANAICDRVIGQENVRKLLISVYLYIKMTAMGETVSNNVILAAPSGCGKTETYRALREYFATKIPKFVICQKDLTSITEEGYKGDDTIEIVRPLMDRQSDGVGIIFLDEFDKKLLPSKTDSGRNVSQAVQAQLLTLVEGREIKGIDTNLTMFVGMGSFDSCRVKRENKPRGIGFTATAEEEVAHYDEITIQDALDMGALPELIGRFTSIINFHELSDKAIDMIIKKNIEKVEKAFFTKVKISKTMKEYLRSKANSEFGCRMFYNILYEQTNTMVERILTRNGDPFNSIIYLDDVGKGHYKKCPLKKELPY